MIPTEIKGEGFTLRKLKKSDSISITKYCNDKEISENTGSIPHPYALKDGEWFVNDCTQKWKVGSSYSFGIVVDKEVIGICTIGPISKIHEKGELGYWLARPFWNKGIMTKAVRSLITFSFNVLNLHRIEVLHVEGNEGSRKIIERLGFTLEGKRKEAFKIGNTWHNDLMYGLLKKEFKK